jgi:hypothetical protein
MIQQEKNTHNKRKTAKTIALVAAAAAILMTTAFASGLVDYLEALLTPADQPSDIAQAVLTVDDISTEKPELVDALGNSIEAPDMERVSADEDTVLALTEGYLYNMDAVLSLDNGMTITFDSFIMDEQGMGILTYTVSDPDGLSWSSAGYGEIYSIDGMSDPQIWTDDHYCFSHMYLLEGDNSDTEIHVAQYFAMGQAYQAGQSLLFTVPENENGTLRITPVSCVPATEMTDDQGYGLTLSPFGLRLGWHADNDRLTNELVVDEIVLHYADGTDYVVRSDSTLNMVLGGWQSSEESNYEYLCQMFNRLVDTDTVTSVTVTGTTYTETADGTGDHIEESFTFTR